MVIFNSYVKLPEGILILVTGAFLMQGMQINFSTWEEEQQLNLDIKPQDWLEVLCICILYTHSLFITWYDDPQW